MRISLAEHRQQLAQQLEQRVQDHNGIKQDVARNTQDHPLMLRIAEWKQKSVDMINRVANQCRTDVETYIQQVKSSTDKELEKLAQDIKRRNADDDYTEKDLKRWAEELKAIRNELERPTMASIENDETKSPLQLITVKFKVKKNSKSTTSINARHPIP